MEIYSENLLKSYSVDTEIFRNIAEEILSRLEGPEGEGTVVFVGDERIRELNGSFRDTDKPTDVLSFCCADEEHNRGVLGDVYISLETADRQALERDIPLSDEVLRLAIHGLLHLVGHTHDTDLDGDRMRDLEESFHNEYLGRVTGSCRKCDPPAEIEESGEYE